MRIFKHLSFALLLSIICNSCKKSPTYIGKYADEPIVEAAYKVELLSIELLSFSFSASAYSANDLGIGNGPDVYFMFDTDGSYSKRKYTYNQVYNNMLPSNLPYKFVFSQPVLLYSNKTVKILKKPQSFDDLYITGFSPPNIIMLDYDGPAAFSSLSIHNQTLTSFDIADFIFKPGINKVLAVKGDAIIEYRITKI